MRSGSLPFRLSRWARLLAPVLPKWQSPDVEAPPSPRVSEVYVDGAVNVAAEQDRVAQSRNESATDGYTTVDLRVGAQVLRRITLKVGVQNLFDVAYTNHLNAKNPFSGARIPEPGRVLSTTLTVEF